MYTKKSKYNFNNAWTKSTVKIFNITFTIFAKIHNSNSMDFKYIYYLPDFSH